MAVSLPNGVVLSLASTYGSAITVTAATNANPTVLTTGTVHGLTNGDIVEVTSGWSRLSGRLCRVTGASGSTLSLEGIDASSTTLYPAGSGTGSIRKITAWTQIAQVLDLSSSGGEMQYVTYSFLEQDFETQLPTQASSQSLAITIADDSTLAGYIALRNAAAARTAYGLRAVLPSGAILLYNGYVDFNETPSMTKNQLMGVKSAFSLVGRPVRYAS